MTFYKKDVYERYLLR